MSFAPRKVAEQHAHDKARALGWAAAGSAKPNPYPHGSQCWILFERAKGEAVQAEQKKNKEPS